MAKKKKNIPTAKPEKLTAAQREHFENQTVLATAVTLVSAIFLLYLYRYLNSSYIIATQMFLNIIIWVCDAAILGCIGMYIWKKEKKYVNILVYFVAGALLLTIIRYSYVIKNFFDAIYVSTLWNNILTFLHLPTPNAQLLAFIFVFICLVVYLVATYIYYGLKLRKNK